MTAAQQQQAAKNFAAYWKGKGYEKGESQPFWLSLLRDVYGVEHPEQLSSLRSRSISITPALLMAPFPPPMF